MRRSGKRCKALNRYGEPCRSPLPGRDGFCHLHRAAGTSSRIGRIGRLASVEAKRRRREEIRLREIELAAEKTVRMAELRAAEEHLAASQERLRERRVLVREMVLTSKARTRSRVGREFEAERQALAEEADRLY